MSTRCQIGFYENTTQDVTRPDVLIYRHSDGYPGSIERQEYGVVPDLLPFLRVFDERRGLSDTMYASAWTMWHLIQTHVEHNKAFKAEMRGKYPNSPFDRSRPEDFDGIDGLSHGIDVPDGWHWDIEYYYAVFPDRLDVYAVHTAPENMQLKESHPIKGATD